jgi:hypothetical protein
MRRLDLDDPSLDPYPWGPPLLRSMDLQEHEGRPRGSIDYSTGSVKLLINDVVVGTVTEVRRARPRRTMDLPEHDPLVVPPSSLYQQHWVRPRHYGKTLALQ